MSNDSHAAFPNRIRALVADNNERFLRSASLMLSLLNFRVATCDSPAAAVKLLSGRLKDADVVFIDALRATTCGFDFRGIVETHLCIPVVYLFTFNYNIPHDVAEVLRRNVFAATYVIKKPLDAEDICRLWRIIQWSQVLLRRGQRTLSWLEWPRGNQALPAAVEALMASSSTTFGDQQGEEGDDGSGHFKVVMEGRGRRRKLADGHDSAGSSSGCSRGRVAVRGRPTRNMTEGQGGDDDDDVVPSHQQYVGVQNQQPVRSLFMQPVPQMLNLPRNNPMISADAAGPSRRNVAPWARASYTSTPALLPLPVYHAPARATSSAPHVVYSAQATAQRLTPVYQQQQRQPVVAARAGRGRRRKLDDGHNGGSSGHGRGSIATALERGHPTRRLSEQMNLTEGQKSDGDGVVLLSHQQPPQQNRRGVLQAMDVQNQQHGRSLFIQPIPQMLNVTHINPMISMDNTAGPSSSNATAFAGASNIFTQALLPAYQAPAYASQAPVPELPPQVYQQQRPTVDPFMHMAGGDTTFGASSAGALEAGAHRDTAVAHHQSPSVGAQQEADRFHDVFQAMMEMNGMFPRSYYANWSANGLLDPSTNELAAMVDSGNCSNHNTRSSSMVTGVNGGNSASFMAPQDLMVPTENQLELRVPDISGSIVESPGSSAMFNGYGEMTALCPSDLYDDNTMLSLDPLWDFEDNIPVHAEGQQAVVADDSANTAHATASMSNGGESGGLGPNGNMGATDDGLELLEEYLKDNGSDFLHPQDKKNGHQ